MSSRRSPRTISLEIFDEIDKKGGKALKFDLYKIFGSEAALHRWMKTFFLFHEFLKEVKEGRKTFYVKTPFGQKYHDTLKDGRYFKAYLQISRKKLRPPEPI